MDMNSQPGGDLSSRKDKSVDQYNAESVARKFIYLHQDLRSELDNALNLIGLSVSICFRQDFLDLLNSKQRQELSSLCDDLQTTEDREAQTKKIQTIAALLEQWSR